MSDAPEIVRHDGFGRKLGPLPIWGWALILAAVAFVWVRFFSGKGSTSTASSSAAGALPNVMTTGGYLPISASSTSSGTASPGSYTDNQSWENAAMQQASAYGSTPVALQQALSNFLQGGTLTQEQDSVVNKVIQAIGAPPTGTNGVSNVQSSWQQQAQQILDLAFGGNFTNQDATLADPNSSEATAVNTWANRLQQGMSAGQAFQAIEAGPAHQVYVKNGGKQ